MPILDVRSPREFSSGHIPGAISLPLFSDEERAEIGTAYKQQGRVPAVRLGIGHAASRLNSMIERALTVARDQQVLVHCWRGGMRSRSFAQFLELVELNANVLEGGYKAFRKMVHGQFQIPLRLRVISGLTGVGKTKILRDLEAAGRQVINLECLANHRGSSFGGLGMPPQPTTEQFENDLFERLIQLDQNEPVWVEDEGLQIGNVVVPQPFFQQLRQAPAVFIECSRQQRIENLLRDYSHLNAESLIAAVNRISKRLDGKKARQAALSIHSGDFTAAIEIVLEYYDKCYLRAKLKIPRDVFVPISIEQKSDAEIMAELLEFGQN